MFQCWPQGKVNHFLVAFSVCFPTVLLAIVLIASFIDPPTSSSGSPGSRAVPTLRFAVVVCRHGNRGTISPIQNDPYPINNTKYWPYGIGGLTPHGRIQMLNLGSKIRSFYNGFLNSRYDGNDFYATSTALDRTMLSGEAFLAGLYPPTYDQPPWEKIFPSQLIPLYSNSSDKTLVAEFCEEVIRIRNKTIARFGKDNDALISELNQYLKKYTGMNETKSTDFYKSYDTILSESTEGLNLPSWMQQIVPHPLFDVASKFIKAHVIESDVIIGVIIGDFYKELIRVLKSKVDGTMTPDRKMHLYSGHDFTLVTLQAVLGVPPEQIKALVFPSSAMIFELHKSLGSEDFDIQVQFIDGSKADLEPHPLPIADCYPSCKFSHIVTTTQKFLNFTSFEKRCPNV